MAANHLEERGVFKTSKRQGKASESLPTGKLQKPDLFSGFSLPLKRHRDMSVGPFHTGHEDSWEESVPGSPFDPLSGCLPQAGTGQSVKQSPPRVLNCVSLSLPNSLPTTISSGVVIVRGDTGIGVWSLASPIPVSPWPVLACHLGSSQEQGFSQRSGASF